MPCPDSLLNADWLDTVARLGGDANLDTTARETKAFTRPRVIRSPTVLLRLVLAYCLSERGLRLTVTWAAAAGLADISNVGLLQRLRKCDAWLGRLVGQLLALRATPAARGRLVRLVDATTLPKASREERSRNGVWRLHSAFDLPHEGFSRFELTDEGGGEQLDRIPVVTGEIRIADAAHLQPERIAAVLDAGGDVVVRAAWRNGRWLEPDGTRLELAGVLKAASGDTIDRPVQLHRRAGPPLKLRLVAARLPREAVEAARRRARRAAQKAGYTPTAEGLLAAEWVVLATSLPPSYAAADVLALYRLRWRVELAFKRLKSVIGLHGPPGRDESTARVFILAHLLIALLLEPQARAFEDSPRWAEAA